MTSATNWQRSLLSLHHNSFNYGKMIFCEYDEKKNRQHR